LEIISLDKIDSTQKYLIERIEKREIIGSTVVIAKEQCRGMGSRDNTWSSVLGDLLFSFALLEKNLPKDLPLASSSIYFAYIMKEVLKKYDQNIWLKWPNDIYYLDQKVGGIVTKKVFDHLVCGIGINLKKDSNAFEALDIGVEPIIVLKEYLDELDKNQNWKQIFMKYKLEFNHNKDISTHISGEKTSLENAFLCDDGSLIINKKRIYSLR